MNRRAVLPVLAAIALVAAASPAPAAGGPDRTGRDDSSRYSFTTDNFGRAELPPMPSYNEPFMGNPNYEAQRQRRNEERLVFLLFGVPLVVILRLLIHVLGGGRGAWRSDNYRDHWFYGGSRQVPFHPPIGWPYRSPGGGTPGGSSGGSSSGGGGVSGSW